MHDSQKIAKLCREASYGDYPWEQLLKVITEWVGGDRAMLMHKASVDGYNQTISYNHDPDIVALYNEHYFHQDPRAKHSLNSDTGMAYTGQQVVPNDSYRHTQYYSDITLGADVKDSVHGVICDDSHLGRRAISIQRGFKSEFFGKADLKKLRFVMFHLDRAYRNSLQLVPVLARHNSSDILVYGLIDSELHLYMVDGPDFRPEEFLTIDTVGQRLRVSHEMLAATLPHAIQRAAEGRHDNISLTKSNLSLSPAPPALDWIDQSGVALFVISAPEPTADTSLFARAFGLTGKESQVLDQLASTQDRDQVCQELNISNETLRWHIKNILSKTGHENGMELVNAAVNNLLFDRL